MKICIVSLNIVPYFDNTTQRQYGGAEVQAAVLADAFSRAGAGVTLAVADLPEGETLPFPSVNAFDTRAGLPGTRFFYPRLAGILDALHRADADVYFQHCAGMITGLTAWFCKRNRRAFVYFAGSDTDFFFRRVRISNIRDKALYFWGLRNANEIVAQNQDQARACRDELGRDSTVIPTAVALSDTEPPRKDGTVVWVGALRQVKQPDHFIELARRHPERRFVMIGGGMASEPEYARRILEEAEGVENLTATGRIPPPEVDGWLRRASLLVNTSSVEGFPNAFLEAWQHRTPIVSFVDVDGLLAGEGVGVVCADTDHMATVTGELLHDEPRRSAMGEKARALIESRYAAPALVKDYYGVFERALAAAGRSVT